MTPTATRPATCADTCQAHLPVVQVRSASRRGLVYEVSPDFCPCESYRWGTLRDAAFRCRHIVAAFPAPVLMHVRYCAGPGCYDLARQLGLYCSAACQDRAYAAEAARELAEMDADAALAAAEAAYYAALDRAHAAVEVPQSTPEEVADTEAIKAEIRRELVSAPDTFLARLLATPSPAQRNQAALTFHQMSATGGTRLPDRGGDPLADAWGE